MPIKTIHLAVSAGLGAAVAAASLAIASPAPTNAPEAWDKDQARATTTLARADVDDVDPAAAPGPHGPMGWGRHGRGPGPFGPPPGRGFGPRDARFGPPPPPLAARLAEQETAIGIRENQLDAWRDYSDALQAMLAPPRRPEPKAQDADPFSAAEAMAEDVAARGRAAEKLKSAIEALKPKLSPEQLERAARMLPPPPPPFGPHRFGPHDPRSPEPSPGSGGTEQGPARPG